jgi:DNA-binding NarL/FixJ family response regulator
MESPIRVVVADDHPLVRAGLRLFVESDRELAVVGEADSGESAIAAVISYRPDVLLLDSQMPDCSGTKLVRAVKQAWPAVRILALTTFPDAVHAQMLLDAGAEGCSSKCADCGDLLLALRQVMSVPSEGPLSAASMPGRHAGRAGTADKRVMGMRRRESKRQHGQALTERELEVLKLAGCGCDNRAIGVQLGISSRTVQGHLASVYHRLHVASRTQAVTLAIRLGWLSLE